MSISRQREDNDDERGLVSRACACAMWVFRVAHCVGDSSFIPTHTHTLKRPPVGKSHWMMTCVQSHGSSAASAQCQLATDYLFYLYIYIFIPMELTDASVHDSVESKGVRSDTSI